MHYLLFYEVADDYLARRAQFREQHLEKAWKASERGELVLGGTLSDPLDTALLLFKGDSPAVAENFAKTDPYVLNGLVKRWHVRQWNTVAGETAAAPVNPPQTKPEQSVLRSWKAWSDDARTPAYVKHFTEKVFPKLRAIEGFRGEVLLRRPVDEAVEITVLTLWESMAAVHKFAGPEPERAVIEPEARAALTQADEFVEHFEVLHRRL